MERSDYVLEKITLMSVGLNDGGDGESDGRKTAKFLMVNGQEMRQQLKMKLNEN